MELVESMVANIDNKVLANQEFLVLLCSVSF